MSTGYRPLKFISFEQLTDGRLEEYGVWEEGIINPMEGRRYLVDRNGLLVAYETEDSGSSFVRYARNGSVTAILEAIEEEFETEIVGDQDHRYWGFETAEEYESAYDKLTRDAR